MYFIFYEFGQYDDRFQYLGLKKRTLVLISSEDVRNLNSI